MRIFLTGGTGVLGQAARPLLAGAGHEVAAPGSRELDLFDPVAVARAVAGADAVMHLATRIPKLDRAGEPGAWAENDRLRTDATRILVDAALAAGAAVFVQPTVTFVYPEGPGPLDESTPVSGVRPALRSGLVAERETARFTAAGRRGVVLRFGLLWGPGTGSDAPNPVYGSTLHVTDAGAALAAALTAGPGIYNVDDGRGRVSSAAFAAATGWQPGAAPEPGQLVLSSRIPATTRTVAAVRERPNGSRKSSEPMTAPMMMLVSRSAATSASAACVWAHSTSP